MDESPGNHWRLRIVATFVGVFVLIINVAEWIYIVGARLRELERTSLSHFDRRRIEDDHSKLCKMQYELDSHIADTDLHLEPDGGEVDDEPDE